MKRSALKKRSKRPIKLYEDYLDDLWRTIIKLRDKGIDQYTFKTKGVIKPGKDSHHIFSRKIRNTRWDTRNGILVMGLHNYHDPHISPAKFHDWLMLNWFKSVREYEMLKLRSEIIGVKIDRVGVEILLTQELIALAKLPFDWYELSVNKRKNVLREFRKEVAYR